MCQVWCSSIQGIYAPLQGAICICIVLFMKLMWCNGFAIIYAQLGGQSAIGRCALFFIYRSAKFGVAVFKVSMLNWRRGSICHMYMCIVLYIYIDLP